MIKALQLKRAVRVRGRGPKVRREAASQQPDASTDPLVGMPFMHLWRDCVCETEIHPYARLVLLCLARFMDAEGRGSSMSYAQLARCCGIDESTAKRMVKNHLRDVWFCIEVSKGRLIPGIGRENLYHAMLPPSVVNRVRERRIAGLLQTQTRGGNSHPGEAKRGSHQPHVHWLANQRGDLSERVEGSGDDPDATNVVPLGRPSWGRDLLKGGAQ